MDENRENDGLVPFDPRPEGGADQLQGGKAWPGSDRGSLEGLEAMQRLVEAVKNGVPSENSRTTYQQGIDNYLDWYSDNSQHPLFSQDSFLAYKAFLTELLPDGTPKLKTSTVNLRLSAVRALFRTADAQNVIDPRVLPQVGKVKGVKQYPGVGTWMSLGQARRCLALPDRETNKGKRDFAVLAILFGCALRRAEVARLTVDSLQQQEGHWGLKIIGKGRKERFVPIQGYVKAAIDNWLAAAGITEGRMFRSINKGDRVWGNGFKALTIWDIVREYAVPVLLDEDKKKNKRERKKEEEEAKRPAPRFGPHDARRTCAKLLRAAGGELEQIQILLGHESIETTARYLGTNQDLGEGTAVNDRLRLASV